jgi:hypothetical protein
MTLTKHKSRISSDTEEGLLDLSAVTEGWITIERDGSFKDTEKLTALLTALDAKAATRRAELKAEGLDIHWTRPCPLSAPLRPTITPLHWPWRRAPRCFRWPLTPNSLASWMPSRNNWRRPQTT